MKGRIAAALFAGLMVAAQPAAAQDDVIVIDLGLATDEELAGAMDATAGLELIMQSEWEQLQAGVTRAGGDKYLRESVALLRFAEEAYARGDYEAAARFAEEANRFARLSEEMSRAEYEQEPEPDFGAWLPADDGLHPLPATFVVRSWLTYRDSLWNIAAMEEVFGDPFRWRALFEANRHRMPEPNNPDLIHPGMVLEIPSIAGEVRSGEWQSGRRYRR